MDYDHENAVRYLKKYPGRIIYMQDELDLADILWFVAVKQNQVFPDNVSVFMADDPREGIFLKADPKAANNCNIPALMRTLYRKEPDQMFVYLTSRQWSRNARITVISPRHFTPNTQKHLFHPNENDFPSDIVFRGNSQTKDIVLNVRSNNETQFKDLNDVITALKIEHIDFAVVTDVADPVKNWPIY